MTTRSRAKKNTYPTPEQYQEIVNQVVHADDGLVRLRNFLEMDRVWQAYQEVIVRRARRQGYSWQEIGNVMGISRQAAHARFSPHQDEHMPKEMEFWFDLLKAGYPPIPGPDGDGSSPAG